MEPIPDLSALSEDELSALIRSLEQEEDAISFRRRVLHGRIDILRHEHVGRLRAQVESGSMPQPVAGHEPTQLERPLYEGTGELPPEQELEPLPDLATISDDDLRSTIRELEHEEDDISLRRRVIHGQIDIFRAARYARIREGTIDVSDLARVLTSRLPNQTDEQA